VEAEDREVDRQSPWRNIWVQVAAAAAILAIVGLSITTAYFGIRAKNAEQRAVAQTETSDSVESRNVVLEDWLERIDLLVVKAVDNIERFSDNGDGPPPEWVDTLVDSLRLISDMIEIIEEFL
jgi:hypothetical protein